MRFSEIKDLIAKDVYLHAKIVRCDKVFKIYFYPNDRNGIKFFSLTHSKYEYLGQDVTFSTLDGAANQLKKLGIIECRLSL